MLKAIIYDCDGVLFPSREIIREFLNAALRAYGKKDVTEKQLSLCEKMAGRQCFEYLFKKEIKHGMTYDDFFRAAKKALTLRHFKQIRPMRNLVHTLRKLRAKGFKIGIATNRGDSTYKLLRAHNIAGLFDHIVTSADVRHPKPHPEPLQKVLKKFRLSKKQALFIGDSSFDRDAAKALKMKFIGFHLKGRHPTIHDHKEIWKHINS